MRTFIFGSMSQTMGGERLVKMMQADTGGEQLTIRVSNSGRLISVGLGRQTLMHKGQRKPGGERRRLPAKQTRQLRDVVAQLEAMIAFDVEPEKLAPLEIDL
jgi:hypothetical protein